MYATPLTPEDLKQLIPEAVAIARGQSDRKFTKRHGVALLQVIEAQRLQLALSSMAGGAEFQGLSPSMGAPPAGLN